MSSNPLIPDDTVVHMEIAEWNGLCSLLRAYADGEPERATAGTELEPDELARNYADYIEEDTDGLHRHTESIKDRFPEPLSLLLIEMAERNREHWLESERWRARTIGAESVREFGLTENQRRWANEIAEQMGVPHDAYR